MRLRITICAIAIFASFGNLNKTKLIVTQEVF